MSVRDNLALESGMQLDFLEEIYSIPGGQNIKNCIQCGTCTGSCPVSHVMDHAPRKLFAMIRAGMRDEVLASNTIWTCCSCYSCAVRCPMEIKITDIMYVLKRIAMAEGKANRTAKAAKLAVNFAAVVRKTGRNHEVMLMARYVTAANPVMAFTDAWIGMKLMRLGRLPLKGHSIKNTGQLQAIFDKAEEITRHDRQSRTGA
jgi:heterodisulfide reductase subunit C